MGVRRRRARVLIIADEQDIRHGIERLLKVDGFDVSTAEEEAVHNAAQPYPDLVLVSLAGPAELNRLKAERLRSTAGLANDVPVVIFTSWGIEEGLEVNTGDNIYATSPDNFNQLRALIRRLLQSGH